MPTSDQLLWFGVAFAASYSVSSVLLMLGASAWHLKTKVGSDRSARHFRLAADAFERSRELRQAHREIRKCLRELEDARERLRQ